MAHPILARRRARVGACIAAGVVASALALALAPTVATAVPSETLPTIDLATAGVPEVKAGLESGQFTSVELVTGYLDRIEALSIGGPALNSVRSINPAVYAEAAALDAERAAGTVRGPLHGVPVLVKDNIDVAGMPTTAGALSLADSYPSDDAPLITELRAAGAIILGKTNLSEFANFLTQGMPSGYSSLGGQVLNPYDASQTPSGSSSGSGSAGATGLATLTIGTETSGSILSPARANSLVGVKPTVGLVSRTGIIPISASQDTAGPMVKSVYDAAALLSVMSSIDPEDAATATNPLAATVFEDALSDTSLQGARLGYVGGNTNANDPLYQAALQALRDQGATLVEVSVGGTSAPSILTDEFKRDMNAYLDRLPSDAPIQSFDEIRAFNQANPEAIKFGQFYFDAGAEIDLTDPAQLERYEAARDQGITETRAAIDTVLESNDLDAIVSNSNTTGTGARAGYPSVIVPSGYATANLRPTAIVFLGTAWTEPQLLSFAYDYEQATKLWQAPELINPSLFRCAATSAPDEWTDAACLTIPAAPGPGADPEPTPDPEPTTEPTPDPEPTTEPTPDPEPTTEPTTEPTAEPTPTSAPPVTGTPAGGSSGGTGSLATTGAEALPWAIATGAAAVIAAGTAIVIARNRRASATGAE
ncbi:amidase family protein [Microbacterium aurantiacum]|uniref:amidase family protein n=1 Tax=Microbacterium aurantiacum TaxID=162393 RepID=UPI00344AFF0B